MESRGHRDGGFFDSAKKNIVKTSKKRYKPRPVMGAEPMAHRHRAFCMGANPNQGGMRDENLAGLFLCDNCGGKHFRPVYSFSLRFHGVNFSDNLIYDELAEETYQCTGCDKVFSRKNIEDGLMEIKKMRKDKGLA